MIGEAGKGLLGRKLELVEHQVWVQVSQIRGADSPTNLHPCTLHLLTALNNLHGCMKRDKSDMIT